MKAFIKTLKGLCTPFVLIQLFLFVLAIVLVFCGVVKWDEIHTVGDIVSTAILLFVMVVMLGMWPAFAIGLRLDEMKYGL